METTLATRTLECATAALKHARIACLPEIVKLLNTLSCKTDDVSVMDLAEVIEGDPIIMSKVIAAANTYYYNPNAVAVTNVVQAIHVIGFDRVRSLAMSLMMAEQAERGQTAEQRRAITSQALVAGSISRAIAENLTMVDRDRAFVCGCLRSFGHVVLASCMFEEYQRAHESAARDHNDDAYRTAFGLTPVELGYHLLQSANLPPEILSAIRALPPEAAKALEARPDDQLRALVDCADRLAELTCNPRVPAAEFASQGAALVRHYQAALPTLGEDLHGLMLAATTHMEHLVRTFRLKSVPSRTLSRLRSCRAAVDPERAVPAATAAAAPPAPAAESVGASTAPVAAPPESTAARPQAAAFSSPSTSQPEEHNERSLEALQLPNFDWQQGIKHLATLLGKPQANRRALRRALVDALCAGLGATECLVFQHQTRSPGFQLTEGCGQLHARLHSSVAVHLHRGDRTVFGVCLQRHESVNIHHARDPKIAAYLPDWLRSQKELGAFVLFPMADASKTMGLVLVGWAEPCQITFSPYHVHAIRSTISFVCRAQQKLAE